VYTNLKRSLDLGRLLADQSLWRYVEGGRNSKYIPKFYVFVYLVIYNCSSTSCSTWTDSYQLKFLVALWQSYPFIIRRLAKRERASG